MIIIDEQKLPLFERQPQELSADLSFLTGVKVFDLASSTFISFEELIRTSAEELKIELEFFFPNQNGTQWGYMKIRGSKVIKTLPLLEINVVNVIVVKNDDRIMGYITTYCRNIMRDMIEEFISIEDFSNDKLLPHFLVPPQASKDKDGFCNRLLKSLILSKAEEKNNTTIQVGIKQGLNVRSASNAIWETKDNYPQILHRVIPESITCRKRPVCREGFFKNVIYKERALYDIFERFPDLKVHFLVRTASYFLSFAAKYGVYFSQIINVTPTERADVSLISAIYDNINYGHGEMLVLSKGKELAHARNLLNDAIMCVVDDTKPDASKKRDAGIDVLHETVINCKNDYCQIPVVISRYAKTQLRRDLSFDMVELNGAYAVNSAILSDLLESHDANMISSITKRYEDFVCTFNKSLEIILGQAPYFIPAQRLHPYYILISVMRTYNEEFEEFFDADTEQNIIDMLSTCSEDEIEINDIEIIEFSKKLNEVLNIKKFRFVKRKKYIVFDKGTDTVIIDDNFAYFETATIKKLAEKELNFHSVNTLTDALDTDGSLNVNMHNSKCYKFTVQNSQGESYNLYTYGISKLLINQENRNRFDLADKGNFLLTKEELFQSRILPLGVTVDGNFVGKDISYQNKTNDSIFITGQSGKGKSFFATNLLTFLKMLGNLLTVYDVSRSFSRDDVLRAFDNDEDLVNKLFDFIEVDNGKNKLPYHPLFVGDCKNLPAKKRRVCGFVTAIESVDKDNADIIKDEISNMLQKNSGAKIITKEMLVKALTKAKQHKLAKKASAVLNNLAQFGYEEQGYGDFIKNTDKIPIISLGDETGEIFHSVLDALISSAFEWQRDHKTSPLTLVLDEIKYQNFAVGSPLHSIITQGRKFSAKLIGLTQEYVSRDSHAYYVMREAGIKIIFEPANSRDAVAVDLGFKNAVEAGLGNMDKWEYYLKCDGFDKINCCNGNIVIRCHTVKFKDTLYYEAFKKEYGLN